MNFKKLKNGNWRIEGIGVVNPATALDFCVACEAVAAKHNLHNLAASWKTQAAVIEIIRNSK